MTWSEVALNEAICELQTKVAFQEDTINALNRQVVAQDRDIRELSRQVKMLYTKMATLTLEWQKMTEAEPDELPPHY